MAYATLHAATRAESGLTRFRQLCRTPGRARVAAIRRIFPANTSNESDLGDDVVTLSYESALRSHARYKTPDRGNREPVPATRVDVSLTAQAGRVPQDVLDHELRTTSVTIRLSKAECASLHQRAAEAGALGFSLYPFVHDRGGCTSSAGKVGAGRVKVSCIQNKPAVPGKERRSFRGWVISGGWRDSSADAFSRQAV